jgi:hypothetical protein
MEREREVYTLLGLRVLINTCGIDIYTEGGEEYRLLYLCIYA